MAPSFYVCTKKIKNLNGYPLSPKPKTENEESVLNPEVQGYIPAPSKLFKRTCRSKISLVSAHLEKLWRVQT